MSENTVAVVASKSPKKVKTKATKTAKAGGASAKPSNPTYFKMIMTAIRDLKEPRGSSRQAILKYIVDKYKLDAKVAASHCRLAIKKSLVDGRLKHGKSECGL